MDTTNATSCDRGVYHGEPFLFEFEYFVVTKFNLSQIEDRAGYSEGSSRRFFMRGKYGEYNRGSTVGGSTKVGTLERFRGKGVSSFVFAHLLDPLKR